MTNSRRTSRGPVYLIPGPGTGPRPGGWETLKAVFKYFTDRAASLTAQVTKLQSDALKRFAKRVQTRVGPACYRNSYLGQRFRCFAVNASDFCDVRQVWSGVRDCHMAILKDEADILHHLEDMWHWRTEITLHQILQVPPHVYSAYQFYCCQVHGIQYSWQKIHVVSERSREEWCHWKGNWTAPIWYRPHIKCYSVDIHERCMKMESESDDAFWVSTVKYEEIVRAPRIHQLLCFRIRQHCIAWLEKEADKHTRHIRFNNVSIHRLHSRECTYENYRDKNSISYTIFSLLH
jgi:hypothetical protein